MKSEIIQSLAQNFEDYTNTTESAVEFWFARDLQHLLGYKEWRNFSKVINKAKTACEASGNKVLNHFVDFNKMVNIGSGAQKPIVISKKKKLVKNPKSLKDKDE